MKERIHQTLGNKSWRLSHLYSVVNKLGQRVKYRPNSIQAQILSEPSHRKMILKARQFGVSTHCILDQLDKVLFTSNYTACIIAHEQDSIRKLFRIAARAYHFMDDLMKPRLDRGGGSKYEMYFPGINSRIYCDLNSRGDTIQNLHVSETAFIKDPDQLKATMQTVPITGAITLETTPNGMGNFFYDLWNDEKQNYKKLFFPWFQSLEYSIDTDLDRLTPEDEEFIAKVKARYGYSITSGQIAFRKAKQAELGNLFVQEYPEDDQTCFLASGSAAMDLAMVKYWLDLAPEPVYDHGDLKIYQPFNKNDFYVIGADTSEGVGKDFSAASVFNVRTREQVATLRAQYKPYDFAHRLNQLAEMFHAGGRPYPLLAVERNNHGHSVLLELEEHIQYRNLFKHDDERLGWLSNKVTRPIMIDTLIEGVEHKSITLLDTTTLKECMTLIDNNGKIEAATGKHDDSVIAASIALQMVIASSHLEVYNDIESKIRV